MKSMRALLFLGLQEEIGLSVDRLAGRFHLSIRSVESILAGARSDRERSRSGPPPRAPKLVPLFPVGAFTPDSPCPHYGPIKAGSNLACMVCGKSGRDGHPALVIHKGEEQPPDPRIAKNTQSSRESRRRLRSRLDIRSKNT
jgi:hypothetical protein